ncbi:MAG: phage holin family protein [Corynebacterium sp.]|nr:phage holin family protein [Corynebacterium sp.]
MSDGLFTDGTENIKSRVENIPLTDADARGQGSLGQLVSDATAQMSSLFRSEVELAKAELAAEAKRGIWGGGFFSVAAAIGVFSSFFFFAFIAALLNLVMPLWASLLIVFVVMLFVAIVLALLGVRKVRSIRVPKATIDSAKQLTKLVPGKAEENLARNKRGMYN